MSKDQISEYSSNAADNTDVGGINLGEGMAPSDVNNAIRELMAQLKNQEVSFVASTGSSLVGHIATGAGAEARTVQTKLRDSVSVKDFGAVGNGVTDDQTDLVAAVSNAYTNGYDLYWPTGTYVSTANIPNFHDVFHVGAGILKRGDTLFYVDPTEHQGVTNNLYVSTSGADTNDGLSSSVPRLTVQSMGNVIYNYPWADITWAINFAAGTYLSTITSFDRQFPSPRRIKFLGVSVGNGVQPTVIIQAATPTVNKVGWYFQNNIRVQVSDINFKSFRDGASPNSNELGIGLVVDGDCELLTTNLWTDNCDQGIYATNGCHIRVTAGRHGFNSPNGADIQLIRHCSGTIGFNGTLADVNGVTGVALLNGAYGVLLQEYSMAHTDYCYFSDKTLAGVLANVSRVHSVSSTYLNCIVGIDGRMGANIGNTSNTFTTCTTDVIARSNTTLAGVLVINSTDISPPTRQVLTSLQQTQSTIPVTIYTKNFIAKEFQNRGTGFELKLYGEVVGTAGTKIITVTFGSTTLLTATIAASTTDYEIQVKVVTVTNTSQYAFTRILQNGVVGAYVFNTAISENFTTAKTLTATHRVTNAADLNRIGMIELELSH